MAAVFVDPAALGDVPELDRALAGSDGYLRALAVPVEAGDGVWDEVAELEDSVVVGVPEIEAGVQCH